MVRTARRHSSSLQSQIKDYFVPIIGAILLLVLIYSFFSKDTVENTVNTTENKNPTSISFGSIDSEAYIVYPSDEKEKINESSLFYKGEKIIVKTGSIKLLNPDGTSVHINKIGELEYNEDGSYNVLSSEAWFDLKSDTKISLKYASIDSPSGSVLSLTQNEAASIIYVLSGSAKITNLGWVSTSLVKWQKLSVSRLNAASKDIDLSAEKWNIDSYFKWTDWFIDNQGHLVLQKEDVENPTATSSWEVQEIETQSGSFLSFDTLRDEMSVESNTLSISWNIYNQNIESITVNNRQASINKNTNSFRLDALPLTSTMNDIVIKIYDSEKNILEKMVYTVYTSRSTPASSNTQTETSQNTVSEKTDSASNSSIDPSDFWFTEPSTTGKFTTTSGEITIRGYTNSKDVAKIQVNGFPLSSYNGSTWRYHAFERFETLETGTNQYKVDYLNAAGKVIYSDYFTIMKKDASGVSVTPVQANTAIEPPAQKEDTTTSPE